LRALRAVDRGFFKPPQTSLIEEENEPEVDSRPLLPATTVNYCKQPSTTANPMFDPTVPATNAEATSAMFRNQFNGLKELIDAVPAGPPGENGTSVTGAVIDGTNTLNPG
jgi:hypothetical protein